MTGPEDAKEGVSRYVVFGYDRFYPLGGWNDFVSSHETPKEAREAASSVEGHTHDYRQVIDLDTGCVIAVCVRPPRYEPGTVRYTFEEL